MAGKKIYRKNTVKGSCSAVIVAAGTSTRMNGLDKCFAELAGKPVLAHTLCAFQSCDGIDEIIVAARAENLERIGTLCSDYGITKAVRVVVGGTERLDSVANGIAAASKRARLIAIHDGARPCVTTGLIERTIAAARKYHAAAPAVPVVSTLKRVKGGVITETVDRSGLFEIQTPQVFDADLIKAALANAKKKSIGVTDDCMAVEALGMYIHTTEGFAGNLKITTPDDLILAESLIKSRQGSDGECE